MAYDFINSELTADDMEEVRQVAESVDAHLDELSDKVVGEDKLISGTFMAIAARIERLRGAKAVARLFYAQAKVAEAVAEGIPERTN